MGCNNSSFHKIPASGTKDLISNPISETPTDIICLCASRWCIRNRSRDVIDLNLNDLCWLAAHQSFGELWTDNYLKHYLISLSYTSVLILHYAYHKNAMEPKCWMHNHDVIMSAMASQITSIKIVHSTVYSGVDRTSKLHVTGLCAGNSTVTREFPAQRARNAEKSFHLMTSSWSYTIYNAPLALLSSLVKSLAVLMV